MQVLYSDMLPMGLDGNQLSIVDCFLQAAENADRIAIAVGYVSKASLVELDDIVERYHIRIANLTIGMYLVEGMPESSYHTAIDLNRKWQQFGKGEVRLVKPFKYHGKVYCFYKNNVPFCTIIGSANLSFIKLEASNRRQYELAAVTYERSECDEIALFIEKLNTDLCSINIKDVSNLTLIREENTSLSGIDSVMQLPKKEVELYLRGKTMISFTLPIKVPGYDERHMDDSKHFTKSNLNVCYAAPRSARKSRDWYETQFTVSKEFTTMKGYPDKGHPFFVITDDGYLFKMHTTSDGNKQFSAVGDELILGRWIKGRLAAAGLVTPVNNTKADTDRKGMITKEMLAQYGCDCIVLTKTTKTAHDEKDGELDVWVLSFEAESREDS